MVQETFMNMSFNLDTFISEKITQRPQSLLAEDLSVFDTPIRKEITGKSVLVIGAAGTIGASFVRAILTYAPQKLVVVDINENGLTELVRDCRSRDTLTLPNAFKSYPINFGEPVFKKIFLAEGPFDIVANFAAHKHVRSEKDIYSIEAMIENNVLKAKGLLDLLLEYPPQHFFCVSTDKAANPVNIMGASKKLMENLILAYSKKLPITTARFANVAFSNGSLPAGFIERVMKRQPLSCPSDVRRYFVSPEESGQLCLMACVLGKSGEIFFPKLQEKDLIYFSSIAENFLEALGLSPEACDSEEDAKKKAASLTKTSQKYPLYLFKSDTSGEKLYEEFYTQDEKKDLTRFKALGVIQDAAHPSLSELNTMIKSLETCFSKPTQKSDIVDLLKLLLPNFQHIETGLNLDQKM